VPMLRHVGFLGSAGTLCYGKNCSAWRFRRGSAGSLCYGENRSAATSCVD